MRAFDHIDALIMNNVIDRSAGVKAPDLRACEAKSSRRQNTTFWMQIDKVLNQSRQLRSNLPKVLFELDQSGKQATVHESPSSRQQRGEHF